VLWLSRGNPLAEANLRSEAQRRGVEASRLVFAPRVPSKDDHVARLALADLGLDTRIYSGHSSTVDALLAGVPVVTLRGSHFASRGSASVLSAAGLPELITSSLAQYETTARRLALARDELTRLRGRLARHRATAPLFDPRRFARNIERAYGQMWAIFAAGQRPRPIDVSED
jgi:predicted O-linked N-acetylglucosamine transferase (SPINDLY family)